MPLAGCEAAFAVGAASTGVALGSAALTEIAMDEFTRVQPVAVTEGPGGRMLYGPAPGEAAEATVVLTHAARACRSQEAGRLFDGSGAFTLALDCDDGKDGLARFELPPPKGGVSKLSVALPPVGTEPRAVCSGTFRRAAGGFAPFGLSCKEIYVAPCSDAARAEAIAKRRAPACERDLGEAFKITFSPRRSKGAAALDQRGGSARVLVWALPLE